MITVHFITFDELVGYSAGDTEKAHILKFLLINEGVAQKPKYGEPNGISKTEFTEERLKTNYFSTLYNNRVKEIERMEQENKKINYEIEKMEYDKKIRKQNSIIRTYRVVTALLFFFSMSISLLFFIGRLVFV